MNVSMKEQKFEGSEYNYVDTESNFTEFYDPDDLEQPCNFTTNNSVNLVIGPYIHSIISILGFVGNSLVIITYALYKRSKSMTDVYLLNVAIADLLFVLALPFIVYNELYSWPMGQVACKLLRGSYSVNMYSGMLMLACISTDRYIAIVQARRSFGLRSLSHSYLICAFVWTLALVLSIPTFVFYDWYKPSHSEAFMLEQEEEITKAHQYFCEMRFQDNLTAKTVKVTVPSLQLAVGFFLPLIIMMFCYTAVIVTLMKAKNFQRHKAVKVVLVVVLVFITCHLPYNILLLYDTANMFQQTGCDEVDSVQTALTVMQTIAYLHCCLNPVLYAFIGVKFRNHFRRIFRDLWCVSKKYMTPRRFSRVTSDTNMSTFRRSMDASSETGTSFTM
ncbi:C-C chemokine receptor type 6a [Austrofundulus limnaeus]|uniref:C-C chemokine receptor type 6 n=1 Tax=Austrofundulus limnaeus TaxID=52670 RepID=A0A2I4CZN3_AUSLI|nr:PREDICTED: C-C chemokine receptor type 6 [Austrofundulus limnaeus]XP_013885440.1 PREDICTED: C-C chemokine receptor type 6 [Austrofundulus limnaeus]